jgi:hypothetical protein
VLPRLASARAVASSSGAPATTRRPEGR